MKNITALFITTLILTVSVSAQFSIPKINLPKNDKPKVAAAKTSDDAANTTSANNNSNDNSARSNTSNSITLLKRTIQITPRRFMRYWKNPKAAEPVYDTYSWIPKIQFDVLGPVEAGSKVYVEFSTPDGKPWMKVNMRTPELETDYVDTIKPDDMSDDELEKQAILTTGVFPFQIKIKNALAGTDAMLFSGKFKVGVYALDQSIPENKNKKDFYVDYDWHLPLAYLWLNPKSDAEAPQLSSQFVLRGEVRPAKLEVYLFHNGKQIAKEFNTSVSEKATMTSGADEPSHRWAIWEVLFSQIRGFNKKQYKESLAGQFFLDQNPGEYEIKVLRDNQLARVIKFTVGADGKIVDNNIAKNAKLGGVRLIFPAQILGSGDGAFNKQAWQTEGLFYTPLAGFSAQ